MELRNLRISPAQAQRGGMLAVPIAWERCPQCRGRGYSAGYRNEGVGLCIECKGVGKIESGRTIELKLPAGLRDGARLKIPQQGSLRWDGKRDDLVYVVKIKSDWGINGADQSGKT